MLFPTFPLYRIYVITNMKKSMYNKIINGVKNLFSLCNVTHANAS